MGGRDQISTLLRLKLLPIAIKFQATPPDGVPRVDMAAPAGCSYWKYAAQGRTFYTTAQDHYGCPIGSYTHGIDLPADKSKELDGLIETMVDLKYLRMDEVAGIPRRGEPFGVVVYAPLADAQFEPDVVLVSGTARQLMLLAEAANAAGIEANQSLAGRPTCAAIPAVMQSRRVVANLGCIGNRVYTELPDDQLYFAFAGSHLSAIVEKLDAIVSANFALEQFHRTRVLQTH